MVYGTDEFVKNLRAIMRDNLRHDLYELTVEHAEEMGVHVYGNKPEALLKRVRPGEDPAITEYRLDNFESTTKSSCDKAIRIISKMFNPTLYSIRWKENSATAKDFKDYTLDYYPVYNSIIGFNKDVVLRKMLADPNGIMAIKPRVIPEKQTENLEPVSVIYGSPNIFFYDDDHYLINTKVTDKKHFFFEYYDGTFYRYFESWATTKETIIEDITEYQHGFNEIPVWSLKGYSDALDNGLVVYKSYLSSALPHWNLATSHESDLLGAYITHMHPQKYELSEECNYTTVQDGQTYPCHNGEIRYPDGVGKCPSCKGTGKQSVKSPYNVYQYSKDKLSEDGISMQPVGYIKIETDATEMLEKRTDKQLNRGMWAINMDVEDEVGENQSGIAKVIDRSGQSDSIYDIASVMFDQHLQNQFYFINKYRYEVEDKSKGRKSDKNLPEINKPSDFDIASVSELINNFKVSGDSKLDRNFLQNKQMEIVGKDLSTNPDLKMKIKTLLELDPFPGLDPDQVDVAAMKYGRKTDAIIHFNLKAFLDRALLDNPKFLELDTKEQLEVFLTFAQEYEKQSKPQIDPNLIDPNLVTE